MCIQSLKMHLISVEKMHLISVESNKIWQKYIENIPDTLCIQLSTSDIKRIGFIRITNNCQLIMSIS